MDNNPYLRNGLAGLTNSSLVLLVGYPFDILQITLQNQKLFYKTKSTWNGFQYLYQNNGLKGFYRGASIPFIGFSIIRPLQFNLMEILKNKYQSTPLTNFGVGFLSGGLFTIINNPIQVLKIKTQTNYLSPTTNIKSIWKNEGIKGFYRGLGPTFLVDTFFSGIYVGIYYTLRDYNKGDSIWKSFINGSIAHCAGWISLMPIDYVKTNLQNRSETINVIDILKKGYQSHGFTGFWRGIISACSRGILISGVSMAGYEFVRQKFD